MVEIIAVSVAFISFNIVEKSIGNCVKLLDSTGFIDPKQRPASFLFDGTGRRRRRCCRRWCRLYARDRAGCWHRDLGASALDITALHIIDRSVDLAVADYDRADLIAREVMQRPGGCSSVFVECDPIQNRLVAGAQIKRAVIPSMERQKVLG